MRKGAAGFDARCDEQWAGIERLVSAERAEQAVRAAADEAVDLLGWSVLRFAGWGWSGGKDSLALEAVVDELRGRRPEAVPGGVCGIIRPLEFPNMLEWTERHLPRGVEVVSNDALDLAWLARPENARYVFKSVGVPGTTSGGLDAFWTLASSRRAQHLYMRQHRPAMMLYGRRVEDKNVCGDARGLMNTKLGWVYNPIRGWDHLLTLGVVWYLWSMRGQRSLPPIYGPGRDGWSTGTASWPSRRLPTWRSRDDGWASTYAIDPRAVEDAARRIPDAALWLDRRAGRVAAPGSAPPG